MNSEDGDQAQSQGSDSKVSSLWADQQNPHIEALRDIIKTCLKEASEGEGGGGMSHRK